MSLGEMRLRRARANLLENQVLLGLVAMKFTLKEDAACSTFWCDGKTFGYNPVVFKEATDLEARGMLAKASLHAMLGHNWRMANRLPTIWKQACDEIVVPLVLDYGYLLPGHPSPKPEFKGWYAEAVYRKLKEEHDQEQKEDAAQKPRGDSAGDEGAGPQGDAPGPEGDASADDEDGTGEAVEPSSASATDPEDEGAQAPGAWREDATGELRPCPSDVAEEQEAEIAQAVESGLFGQAQGSLPGSVQMAVAQSKSVRVNWKEHLWEFAQRSGSRNHYDWGRPNKRFAHTGVYLPSLRRGKKLPPFVLSYDSSGSIFANKRLVEAFIGETQNILDAVEPTRLDVLAVDAQVQGHWVIEAGDELTLDTIPGGGGTSFVPAFRWVEEQEDEPACLVYLTDLAGTFPETAPDYPVLWVVPDTTGRLCAEPPKVPFGELLVMPFFD